MEIGTGCCAGCADRSGGSTGWLNLYICTVLHAVNPNRNINKTIFLAIEQNDSYLWIKVLGGCPRIESLLRKSGFWPIFPMKLMKYSKYSPHLIEKMASKPLSLVRTPILGQPPRPHFSQALYCGATMPGDLPRPEHNDRLTLCRDQSFLLQIFKHSPRHLP